MTCVQIALQTAHRLPYAALRTSRRRRWHIAGPGLLYGWQVNSEVECNMSLLNALRGTDNNRYSTKKARVARNALETKKFIDRFRENYVNVPLVRIGGEADGSYVMPDVFQNVTHCFSPGVNQTADFEKHLADDYGIVSFMADASVDAPPFEHPNFAFLKKFVGSSPDSHFITLGDWMARSLNGDEGGLALQMDIEGGEFDVLCYESAETLARFSTLAIEFHGFNRLFDKHFLIAASAMFEKLYQNFYVCHAHPNNCKDILVENGVAVPKMLEVTFIRKDIADPIRSDDPVTLPHPLDRANSMTHKDAPMPDMWWTS